jgi:hypothetical protein
MKVESKHGGTKHVFRRNVGWQWKSAWTFKFHYFRAMRTCIYHLRFMVNRYHDFCSIIPPFWNIYGLVNLATLTNWYLYPHMISHLINI